MAVVLALSAFRIIPLMEYITGNMMENGDDDDDDDQAQS